MGVDTPIRATRPDWIAEGHIQSGRTLSPNGELPMQIDFEDVSLIVGGVEYGIGFCGTAEIDGDGEVETITVSSLAKGKPDLVLPFPPSVVGRHQHNPLWIALAAGIESKYADRIDAYRRERRAA